jgi:hypothetical protein
MAVTLWIAQSIWQNNNQFGRFNNQFGRIAPLQVTPVGQYSPLKNIKTIKKREACA